MTNNIVYDRIWRTATERLELVLYRLRFFVRRFILSYVESLKNRISRHKEVNHKDYHFQKVSLRFFT